MSTAGSKNTTGIHKSHAELHKATLYYMQCHDFNFQTQLHGIR
jgi:hypothetical protein